MEEKKSKKKIVIIIIIILFIIAIAVIGGLYYKKNYMKPKTITKVEEKKSEYRMSGNSIENFDLSFLKLENNNENMLYSPISIKNTLGMLQEGATGEAKQEIEAVIGDYKTNKYVNSKNLSFANALFVRNTYKDSIKETYVSTIKDKYNAEVVYDDFKDSKNINSWVKTKTLKLIDNITKDEDVKSKDFILTNALAIDMDWKKPIQPDINVPDSGDHYHIEYANEAYSVWIEPVSDEGSYESVKFNNKNNVKSSKLNASINKYDIVNTLGEDSIRKTVGAEYDKWIKENSDMKEECGYTTKDKYLDKYIKEINENYKRIDSSTDFMFNVTDNEKVFAKDLKEYDGRTLQYIGIMPTTTSLNEYIKNVDSAKINELINGLKDIKLENFKEGVITRIDAYIPLFKFNYEMNLKNNLNKLNITKVFDGNTNLSKISENAVIDSASHVSTIDFSNQGIKAAAVSIGGGYGDEGGCFEYDYEVPVEKIDLTFNNPYMFIIRDKESGEAWFTGTVYEPTVKKTTEVLDDD